MKIVYKDNISMKSYLNAKLIPMLVLVILPIIFMTMAGYDSKVWYEEGEITDHPFAATYYIPLTDNNTIPHTIIYSRKLTEVAISPLPISYFHNIEVFSAHRNTPLFHVETTGFSISGQVLFSIPFIAYAFYPLRYRGETYFQKRGYLNVIAEYEFVKRILYIEIPALIILDLLVFTIIPAGLQSPYPNILSVPSDYLYYVLLSPAKNMLLFSVTAGLIWLLSVTKESV